MVPPDASQPPIETMAGTNLDDGPPKPSLSDISIKPTETTHANDAVSTNEEAGERLGQSEPEAEQPAGKAKGKDKKKKKKKKSGKSTKKKAQEKPTGFEEYYVDAPMTPDDYYYEQEIYDTGRPALFRIQEALVRYQQKRRLTTERMQVFARYLVYGGVEVGPKLFGGVTERELQEMDKENVYHARSQTDIGIDKLKLAIDFDLVVKGFLTSYFPDFFNPDSEEMVKLATGTIKNFLNYLLYHDVVPEYKDNLNAARATCDLAEKQLVANMNLLAQGPGDFNKACSTLLGGYHFEAYGTPDRDWVEGEEQTLLGHMHGTMTHETALKTMKLALACMCSAEQALRFHELSDAGELRATRVDNDEDMDGFEVTAVLLPDNSVRDFYHKHASDLRVVGRLRARGYRDESAPRADLRPGESLPNPSAQTFEFFVEEELLRFCYPGMKVITTVWELNCGVHFFDEILSVYCSFYTSLFNELMIGWRNPRDLTAESPGDGHPDDGDRDGTAGDGDDGVGG